jgi:hypothetical protein
LLAAAGRNARERVLSAFSPARERDAILAAYREIVA